MVIGHRGVGIAVELGEAIHIVPDRLVVGVKDMGPVLVDLDALQLPGIDIAAHMVPLVEDQHALALLMHLMGEHRAEKPRAYDQIVIHRLKPSQRKRGLFWTPFFYCSSTVRIPLFKSKCNSFSPMGKLALSDLNKSVRGWSVYSVPPGFSGRRPRKYRASR